MTLHDPRTPTLVPTARGSKKIADALRGVAFPISRSDLVATLSDATLDLGGTQAPLSDIVRGVPRTRFRDADQARRDVTARWLGVARWLAPVEERERTRD